MSKSVSFHGCLGAHTGGSPARDRSFTAFEPRIDENIQSMPIKTIFLRISPALYNLLSLYRTFIKSIGIYSYYHATFLPLNAANSISTYSSYGDVPDNNAFYYCHPTALFVQASI